VAEKRRYRLDQDGKRYLVRTWRGVDGFIIKFTTDCSGCNDYSEGVLVAGPFGCHECGYTGKRRRTEWVPFDVDEYLKKSERLYARARKRALAKEAAQIVRK